MKKLILICTLIILASCSKDVTHSYAYEVSGTANNFNMTIEAAPSGTEQYSNVGSG